MMIQIIIKVIVEIVIDIVMGLKNDELFRNNHVILFFFGF